MITAALLGLVQALTEFLPVSSSGHLRLAHAFAGFDAPDDLLFDIVLHLGTLVAVVLVYRARVGTLLTDVVRSLRTATRCVPTALREHEGLRYLLLLVIATLPTGIIGVLLSDIVDSDAFSVPVVGGLLLLNGGILWASKRFGSDDDGEGDPRSISVGGIGIREALIIGVAQGLAVLPGISRSGSTIVCALALGANRMKAAEFSFFLSIPAILGAVVMEFDPAAITAGPGGAQVYIVGALVSAGAGIVALRVLLGVVRAARLHHFAWYCWILGVVALAIGLI